jgi:hypothetical protein
MLTFRGTILVRLGDMSVQELVLKDQANWAGAAAGGGGGSREVLEERDELTRIVYSSDPTSSTDSVMAERVRSTLTHTIA